MYLMFRISPLTVWVTYIWDMVNGLTVVEKNNYFSRLIASS